MACSEPVSIEAKVFRYADINTLEEASQILPLGTGRVDSITLGSHLHIALVAVRPSAPNLDSGFPTDTLLAYDIDVLSERNPQAKGLSLKDLGLTQGQNSVVYPGQDNRLPTFFLRGKDRPVNLMHGSCRKLHGKGEDCLVLADEIISSSFSNLEKRPSVLFLTGDQIYADDVAAPLAPYITELAIKLLGWEENIRGAGKLSDLKPGDRQKIIKKHARFTAGNAENHLLGFGEFAAMYLLAWNAENWPEHFEYWLTYGQRGYKEQVRQLEGARRDLPAVRRALANIPTYMIFDDHDITDDWNLTREWHDNVVGSDCGKQIVTNGLVAYWAFQGWGNDPSRFSDEFVARIVDHFGKKGNLQAKEKDSFEDFLWNFHGWSFSAPTAPLAIFADCRTQRQYDTFKGAPQLIGEQGFLSMSRVAEDAGFSKGDPVIIVVPTPVFGFYLIEALQKALAHLTSIYAADLESWYANTSGRVKFLTFLLRTLAPSHCIFLSGDVHFGFTVKAAYAPLQEGYGYDDLLSITQLNSSAMKTTSLVKIALVSEILGRIRQLFPFKRLVRTGRIEKIRGSINRQKPDWVEARSIVHASGSRIPPLIISDNNIGLVRIEKDLASITHQLHVRKAAGRTRIHESAISVSEEKHVLEDSVRERISRIN